MPVNETPHEQPNIEPVFREEIGGLETLGSIFVPFWEVVQMNRTLWAVRDAVRGQPEYVAGYRVLRDVVHKLVHDTITKDREGDKTLPMIRALRRSTHPYDHLLGAHALALRDSDYARGDRPEPDPQLEESEWRLLFEAEPDPEIRARVFAELVAAHDELDYLSPGRPHLRPLVRQLGEVVIDFTAYRAFDYPPMNWDSLDETNGEMPPYN